MVGCRHGSVILPTVSPKRKKLLKKRFSRKFKITKKEKRHVLLTKILHKKSHLSDQLLGFALVFVNSQNVDRTTHAIPIRPVPGKIRHSNLVFYFRELVKFSGTVTEHFCCPFYRNYTFIGTIVNDERALIKYIARKTKFL